MVIHLHPWCSCSASLSPCNQDGSLIYGLSSELSRYYLRNSPHVLPGVDPLVSHSPCSQGLRRRRTKRTTPQSTHKRCPGGRRYIPSHLSLPKTKSTPIPLALSLIPSPGWCQELGREKERESIRFQALNKQQLNVMCAKIKFSSTPPFAGFSTKDKAMATKCSFHEVHSSFSLCSSWPAIIAHHAQLMLDESSSDLEKQISTSMP